MSSEPPPASGPPDRAQVVREAKDILLKRLAQSLQSTFLAGLGLDLAPIVAVLPAELPILEVRVQLPDLLFRLADASILHVEFQTTLLPGDLRRFSRYNYAVVDHYTKADQEPAQVYTVVLYGPGISQAPVELSLGSHVYTVRNLYLGQRDGEAVVARLRDVVASGAVLSPAEQLDVMLLPLMGQRRPLPEVLREVAGLARSLPQETREAVIGTMTGLAYNYVEPMLAEQLLEVLRMANVLEDLLVETLVRGRTEGQVTFGQQAVLSVLATRFGPVPAALQGRIEQIDEVARLQELVRAAAAAPTLAAFEQALDERLA